jgi:nicotinamide riboside kinase
LDKPISVFVKGPSSSGKSHLIERVVEIGFRALLGETWHA